MGTQSLERLLSKHIIGEGRSLEERLSLTDMQETVCKFILERPAPGKHAARSAVRHLLMAWEIRKADPRDGRRSAPSLQKKSLRLQSFTPFSVASTALRSD